jgi:hypothetical protein
MKIWSKDQRPVRFQVLDPEGRTLTTVYGEWLEITPIEQGVKDSLPRPGKAKHVLAGRTDDDILDELAGFATVRGPSVVYRFEFAGRLFQGNGALTVGSDGFEVECSAPPTSTGFERLAS